MTFLNTNGSIVSFGKKKTQTSRGFFVDLQKQQRDHKVTLEHTLINEEHTLEPTCDNICRVDIMRL